MHPKLPEFLDTLEHYVPTVPDEVTQHLLKLSGTDCQDARLVRLVSLAAQKFVAEAAHDAKQAHARRQKQPAARLKEAGYTLRNKRPVLTSEDLAEALQQHGVNVKRPAYFANAAGNT